MVPSYYISDCDCYHGFWYRKSESRRIKLFEGQKFLLRIVLVQSESFKAGDERGDDHKRREEFLWSERLSAVISRVVPLGKWQIYFNIESIDRASMIGVGCPAMLSIICFFQ